MVAGTDRVNIETHTVQEPAWLQALTARLVEAIDPINLMGPLGYRWFDPQTSINPTDWWVVAAYPTPNEAGGGGPYDGELLFPGFKLDVAFLLQAFSGLEVLEWKSPTLYNGDLDGPEVSIKGSFAGEQVWLRVFSLPPSDEEPSLTVDLASGDWCERDSV